MRVSIDKCVNNMLALIYHELTLLRDNSAIIIASNSELISDNIHINYINNIMEPEHTPPYNEPTTE